MPKIYPVSDLHFRSADDARDWIRFEVPEEADIIAIAGDIANGSKQGVRYVKALLKVLTEIRPKVVVVACLGNHDHWGDISMHAAYRQWEYVEHSYPNFRFLKVGRVCDVKGVRFIGTTLWTDMKLVDDFYGAMNIYHCSWPDYLNVGYEAHIVGFPAYDFVEQFHKQLGFIYKAVDAAKEDQVPFYVMTHHLPDPASLDERYNGSDYNPFYASKGILDTLAVESGIWHHGHTHAAKDYNKYNWRVICNPRGYLQERYSCEDTRQRLANRNLVISLGD